MSNFLVRTTTLLSILIVLALPAFCQPKVYWNRVDNVYGRGPEVILNYAEEFIKANPQFFIDSEKDSVFREAGRYQRGSDEITVKAFYLMKRPSNFCYGSILFDATIAFMAKDARTRVEFRDITYHFLPPGNASGCTGSGTYSALKAMGCCKSIGYLEEYLYKRFSTLCGNYKKLLKSKRGDRQW